MEMPQGCEKGVGLQEMAVMVQCKVVVGIGVKLQDLFGEIKGKSGAKMNGRTNGVWPRRTGEQC